MMGQLVGNFAPPGSNFNQPVEAAIDSSGNLWVTNIGGDTITALVGVAAPLLTPLEACLQKAQNACAP